MAVVLSSKERVEGRAFSDPEHALDDLARLKGMVRQLVDMYENPSKCDFVPGGRPVCMSDPQGRHYRIYYIRPGELFEREEIHVVGFLGQKRANADPRPLIQADKVFEQHFHEHPGLLSLSTLRLADGNFANLVLFSNPEAIDAWNHSQPHYDLVSRISPPYYESIRLNNGILPRGLADPEAMALIRVRYLDYREDPPWRAVRELDRNQRQDMKGKKRKEEG